MKPPPASAGFDLSSVWMIGGAFFLATMGELSHAIGGRCDWTIIALVRAFLMLTTAVILVKAASAKLVFSRPRTLWIRSLAGSFSLVCNFYALTRLPVSDAITLMNVHPLWIVLITAFLSGRRPSLGETLGVIFGLSGVVLIEQPHLKGDGLAALVALLSSFSSAIAMLGLHRLRHVDSRAVVAHFAGVATLVSATCLYFRWRDGSPLLFEGSSGLFVFLIGVGATGTLGQILLTKAYAAGSPAKVATVGLTQVVFAMAFDVVFWNRPMTPGTIAGFVLVLAPTTWLSLRTARSKGTKPVEEIPSEVKC